MKTLLSCSTVSAKLEWFTWKINRFTCKTVRRNANNGNTFNASDGEGCWSWVTGWKPLKKRVRFTVWVHARQLGKLERHGLTRCKSRPEASGYGYEPAQEISKFEAEKRNATADIGDVGFGICTCRCEKRRNTAILNYNPIIWIIIPIKVWR